MGNMFVAQTFEKEHTDFATSAHEWWSERRNEARKLGFEFFRCSTMNCATFPNGVVKTTDEWWTQGWRDDPDVKPGLLFEAWRTEPPTDPLPDPAWNLTQ